MKKILSLLLAVVMAVGVFGVGAMAAGGIDEPERKVLSALRKTVTIAGGETLSIPEKYVVQAENFFLSYEGMTLSQADTIVSYIDQAADVFTKEAEELVAAGKKVDLRAISSDAKALILDLAQKACAVVGLKLVYQNNTVTITDANGNVVFSNAAVIKKTGLDGAKLAVAAAGTIAVALAAAFAAYVYAKKRNAAWACETV